MDAKQLSDLILEMAKNPLTAPHEDLVVYAGTRGWLATRHYNAAMNLHGIKITKHEQRQLMDEIHVSIFRGYILESAAPDGVLAE